MDNKYRVLFVCVHNSARSQMAEAYLRTLGAADFAPESAGLEPGKLNPHVVAVMQEDGIDISANPTKSVFDMLRDGKAFDAVVTVCDGASAERCPVFPGKTKRIAWSFADPSGFTGSEAEIMERTRGVRDEIKASVQSLIEEAKNLRFWMEP